MDCIDRVAAENESGQHADIQCPCSLPSDFSFREAKAAEHHHSNVRQISSYKCLHRALRKRPFSLRYNAVHSSVPIMVIVPVVCIRTLELLLIIHRKRRLSSHMWPTSRIQHSTCSTEDQLSRKRQNANRLRSPGQRFRSAHSDKPSCKKIACFALTQGFEPSSSAEACKFAERRAEL